ncbi:hypothetical protein EBE87_27740 [Pseudoroseomonas wenyumeiae]|uniref:Uncharacterized protein n=1 Tax=Teichococcus wenyumeiae TaxID=2478470 RepID=A0A3A9JF34_9PROT|nr:hypothetical protein [Pseudoroseomonas wenyumeiae]RKK03303.1 hypothetical protein D6Z83_15195 [Pseudoroseomonas wenyumeiae]RMI14583.1 hypothetical protein EBE87_27740 [Pseudoroseomonas wenyumeiae]
MISQEMRDGLEEVDKALRRIGEGTSLIYQVMSDLPGDSPFHGYLHFLIDAQDQFRKLGSDALEKVWDDVLGRRGGGQA